MNSKFDNGFFVNSEGDLYQVINRSLLQLDSPAVVLQPGFYTEDLLGTPISLAEVADEMEKVKMTDNLVRKTHAERVSKDMEFVLSDATPDRYGDVIDPNGWDLKNFSKNPIALFNHNSNFPIGKWENLSVKNGQLRGFLRIAPEGTSPRIDEIRKLIEADILRAVSVGFRPVESKPIGSSSFNYTKSELVETSLVSVPANPNALAIVKSMKISRETQDLIFAKHGTTDQVKRRGLNGEHAGSHSNHRKGHNMSPLVARIESAQQRIVDLKDQLEKHLGAVDDENPAEEATTITSELSHRIEVQEKALETLKRAEGQLAVKASGNTTSLSVIEPRVEQVQYARPFASVAVKSKPADYIYKAVAVALKHFGDDKRQVLDVLKEHYGDGQEGNMVRTVMARMVTKAAAVPADTTTSGWADTLVQTVIGDFIQSLMPHSVYPALAAKGGSFTFGRNGTISLPARTVATAVGGAFIAQGAAIPVKQGAFSAITLTPKKMGVITTMTREITEHSIPAIEAIIRQAMLEDTGVAIDTVLLDATAATTTRPAGLKNGISKVNASVTASIVGFIADIKGLAAALITATSGNIRSPAWIMNPGDVLAASLLQTTTGDTPFRDELAGGTLLGYPIIQSTTGLSDMMCLIDAADFITATGDTPNFSVSDQAVLHMEDTSPTGITTGGATPAYASPVRSLWQTDSIAIRMIMDINWAKRRTGILQWTDTMAWN